MKNLSVTGSMAAVATLFAALVLMPTNAFARTVIYMQPENPGEEETLENFKKALNELRLLIVKAQQLGITVPIDTLAMVGQDPDHSTDFTRDLEVGSKGYEVIALQNFLIKGGYLAEDSAKGTFSEETRIALSRYQAKEGITPAAGFFGEKTRAHIRASVE